MEIKNAIITGVSIRIQQDFILDAYIHLEYDAGCQSFGGWALYLSNESENHTIDNGFAGHFLFRCMHIAGVDSWDKMTGKTIRVKAEQYKVHEIGHILKNEWFNPEKDFKIKQ